MNYCEKGYLDCKGIGCKCVNNERYKRRFLLAYRARNGRNPPVFKTEEQMPTEARNAGVFLRALIWVGVPVATLLLVLWATGIVE